MSHIFVSYSRRDMDIARAIVDALSKNEMDAWIDWESIPMGEDWAQEIYRGIEEADAFLFLISPDSVQSEMCRKELSHAVKNGKRIIPVAIRDIRLSKDIPPEIARLSWITLQDRGDFNRVIDEITQLIHTDYKWMKFHTDLQIKALRWERVKDSSRLLRGKELQEAETRLVEAVGKIAPLPTDIQRQFILASRSNLNRQRRWITLLGVGNVSIILVMAIYIVYLSRQLALVQTQSPSVATPIIQNTETPSPTITLASTPSETSIPVATSTQLVVVVITPEAPISTPESFIKQLYKENRNKTSYQIFFTFIGVLLTYVLGIGAVLLIWWRKGGEFFSRSWLLKLAAKPLLITPGLGKCVLFLGYKKRLMDRPEIAKAAKNYFGLPARKPNGDDILPDAYGDNLHTAIAEALEPQQPVIAVGKGGAGKTTLLSRLAYLALLNGLPVSLNGYRPILVPSEYYEGNFLAAITSVLRKRHGVPLDENMVQAQLETGKFLILFDGISEIEGDQSKGLREILIFAQNSDYKNNRFVFTSRPSFDFSSELSVFQLNPLTPDVIIR
jgi:hypothetical protein